MGNNKPILWVTDPWDTLDHAKDTTLRLAQECLSLGRRESWCDVRSIRFESGRVRLDARRLLEIPPSPAPEAIRLGEAESCEPSDFHSIHFRTDPPVDLAYIHPLQLLAMGAGKRAPIVNPARVLLMRTEKVQPEPLAKLMPPSIAASQWEPLSRFGRMEGRTVLKPMHEAQSKGVELLDFRSSEAEARARLELATFGFSRPVILQRYLSGIAEGEQRLWFLDGKLLAYARKMPQTGDFRVNIDGGSSIVATRLTRREQGVAKKISLFLRTEKIRLAAVDLIESMITDFNFTSPGLIVAMESVLGVNLAKPIARAITR